MKTQIKQKEKMKLLKRKREKKYRRKKQLIECYIEDTETIEILEVTEFSNVWFDSGRLEVTEKIGN